MYDFDDFDDSFDYESEQKFLNELNEQEYHEQKDDRLSNYCGSVEEALAILG